MTQLSPGTNLHNFTAKDGTKIVLRTPKWNDLDEMIDFSNGLVEEEAMVARNTKVTREQGINWLAENLKKLERGQHIYFIADFDGKMVGNCEITPMFGRMSHVGVLAIAVKDGYRGIGIGFALMKEAEKQAIHRGLKIVKLEVFESNEPAIALYEKLGYNVTGRVNEAVLFREGYIDSLLMTKRLIS